MNAAPAPRRLGDLAGWLLAGALLAWAALLHHGLGPEPYTQAPRWFEPRGFLLETIAGSAVAENRWLGLLAFVGPALALTAATFALTRSVLARSAALAAVITSLLFVFYGLRAEPVWRFFHWRWSVAMAAFGVICAGALLAPLWTERWRRFGWPARIASYLPLFALLLFLERNVTGTDQSLRFAISPWPAVQIFGLEVVASAYAALLLGVAAGLALLEASRGGHGAGRVAAALAGAAVAAGFPAASLWLGAQQGLLPFRARDALLVGTALASGVALASAALWPPRQPRRARAGRLALAALLLGAPLVLGQTLTRLDYELTRDVRARRAVEALERHYAREGLYPDRLEDLVAAGDLTEVPRPRIGFPFPRRHAFTYQNFGQSYLLEFSAPRWIQCAWSPPFGEDDEEVLIESAESAADRLGGAWSCPARPPEIW